MNLFLLKFNLPSRLLVLLVLSCSLMAASVQDSSSSFAQANNLYEQQKFEEAAAAYRKLVETGKVSAAVYFNLGNAYFQSGDQGRAIAAYRAAQKLNPRDADIRANLRRARGKVENSGASNPEESFLNRLTVNEWTLLASIPFAVCFLLLAFGQIRRDWQKVTRSYTVALAALALLMGVFAALATQKAAKKAAVVVAEEAVVRHGPFGESQSAFNLRAGAELTVLDERENWIQVSAGRNRMGWVQKAQLSIVN